MAAAAALAVADAKLSVVVGKKRAHNDDDDDEDESDNKKTSSYCCVNPWTRRCEYVSSSSLANPNPNPKCFFLCSCITTTKHTIAQGERDHGVKKLNKTSLATGQEDGFCRV